jgi:hypothetical protein
MRVYEIKRKIRGFAQLTCDDPDFPPEQVDTFGVPKINQWKPPTDLRIGEPGVTVPDFISFSFLLCVRERTWRLIEKILGRCTELLPMQLGDITLYGLNVLNRIDPVDREKSIIRYDEGVPKEYWDRCYEVEKYHFDITRFNECSVFRMPPGYFPLFTYETDNPENEHEFKRIVERHGLTGLSFELIWDSEWPEPRERGGGKKNGVEPSGHNASISAAVGKVTTKTTGKKQEKVMAEWLAHPLEYGEVPSHVEQFYRERTWWPVLDKRTTVYFHRCTFENGEQVIGMTGPATWCFANVDLSDFTPEELKEIFAGWYVSSLASNASDSVTQKGRELVEEKLEGTPGYKGIVEYLGLDPYLFYAYRQTVDGVEYTIATNTVHERQYPPDDKYLRLPVLFHFVGWLFFSGKLE